LFSSIAYLYDRATFNESSQHIYRNMIVEHLCNNEFDESLLDLPKNEYINAIADPSKWGGGIEIKIFTEILKLQIAVVDVQTNRIDLFGQDKAYTNRIFILYNGIHYDPLVMNSDVGADPSTDITIFDSNDNEKFDMMKCLVLEYKNQGDYVEFYCLECKSCPEKFKNENEAVEHSINYNHWEFNQI
jgi:ubiquitin thioesterase OTU1